MYPIKVITVAESRHLEQAASERGLSYAQMMENAGRAAALVIAHRRALVGRPVLLLVGPGNNGGDGLVAAHYLQEMGAEVTCYVWNRQLDRDDNLRRVIEDGIAVIHSRDDPQLDALRAVVARADIIVDALLGVGVSRPIGGSLQELLDVVRSGARERAGAGCIPWQSGLRWAIPPGARENRPLIVAVDCPTGLDCDTGALDPAALAADITVTFAYPKVGLLRFPGAECVGEVVVADIGIPSELAQGVGLEMATADLVSGWLPIRSRAAHKGTFGRALVVAGSVVYTGAAILAGLAATRVGTGLVTMAVPASIQSVVASCVVEATYVLLPHDLGVIAAGAVEVVRESSQGCDALLIGPGLTQEEQTIAFVHRLLGLEQGERRSRIGFVGSVAGEEKCHRSLPPLVIDADALNAISRVREWWAALPPGTILTPHPGEMARLVGEGTTARQVQADREGICRRMAQVWGATVVLKGALTVVAAPDGRVAVIPFANAGLATAGSGDVLAGTVVGLRAQGLGAFEAAVSGAYVHGLSGEIARSDLGGMGTTAGDLPPRLPLALRRIRGAP